LGVSGEAVAVVNILVNSPAYEAGVRPGDLITGLNGEALKGAQDLVSRVAALAPGANVELDGQHRARGFRLTLKVLERPTRLAQLQ
jgi:S1-C subfamily serine protease